MALHGAVRGTIDIDLVVGLDETNLSLIEKTLTQSLGLVSRIPIRAKDLVQFRQEFINKKNLKAWSFVNPNRASEVIDLVILNDLSEYTLVKKEAWGISIPVISIDDLLEMKKEADRDQDRADIEALRELLRTEGKIKEKK